MYDYISSEEMRQDIADTEAEIATMEREIIALLGDRLSHFKADARVDGIRKQREFIAKLSAVLKERKSPTESPSRNCGCGASTGICGRITRGTGKLDDNGYWEHPCPHGNDIAAPEPTEGGKPETRLYGMNELANIETQDTSMPAPLSPYRGGV